MKMGEMRKEIAEFTTITLLCYDCGEDHNLLLRSHFLEEA